MKRLFKDYATCAGVWARQAQDEGHTRGRHMFFYGKVIYSYGLHFPMGRILDGMVLLNDSTHSVATSKHQREVQRAMFGANIDRGWVFYVSTGTLLVWDTSGSKAVYRDYAARIKHDLAKARLPRKRHATKLRLYQECVSNMNVCLRFASLRGESVPVMLTDAAPPEYQLAAAKVELGV